MHKIEFDLKRTPDIVFLQTPTLPERLVLSYLGRLHFVEAIDMAATTKGSDVMNAIVGVSADMVEAGIPPISALKRLTQIRDSLKPGERDPGGRSFMELGMADICGMLGRVDDMKALLDAPEGDGVLWTISPYIYAGEAYARSGGDPTTLMKEAMDRIARSQAHWDNHFGKTIEYVRVARVLHKAGLDPKPAFAKAEETLDAAKRNPDRGSLDHRSYEELGVGYAACGLPEDALRMVDLIRVTTRWNEIRDWDVGKALQKIAQEHLSRGDYGAAVTAAKRLNWGRFTAKMLAHKAVAEVRQGKDASPTINEAALVLKGAKYEEVDEEVYPLLGLALARSGRVEEAEAMFRGIRTAIDEMDVLYKTEMGFELAKAIDEARYEAEGLYRQSFKWADQFRTDKPDWELMHGMSWGMYEHGVRNLIEGGCFDLAKEYLDKYPDDGWSKSRLIADLAKAEALKGLSQAEIDAVTPIKIEQLLSESEQSKQAALYFELA